MKKIILALSFSFLFLTTNVEAWTGSSCSSNQVEEGKTILSNVSYSLEYVSDYVDRYGYFQESYFKLNFSNLPSGYAAVVEVGDGEVFALTSPEMSAYIKSGVHKVTFYSLECDTPLKSFEFFVPHYNQYCGKDVSCEDNIWFDGTFENKPSNEKNNGKSKTSIALIIVLVVLIIIIAAFIAVTIKRRKDREKGF